MALLLLIGNKNYSSWSLRPWIAMKVAGIPFEEQVISLDAADFKERVHKISAAGKVRRSRTGRRKSGNRSPSWTTWPKTFRRPACGRLRPRPARTPAPSRPRCIQASRPCAGTSR